MPFIIYLYHTIFYGAFFLKYSLGFLKPWTPQSSFDYMHFKASLCFSKWSSLFVGSSIWGLVPQFQSLMPQLPLLRDFRWSYLTSCWISVLTPLPGRPEQAPVSWNCLSDNPLSPPELCSPSQAPHGGLNPCRRGTLEQEDNIRETLS